MVLNIKYKLKIYRRFEKDIWGIGLVNPTSSNKYLDFL